MLILVFTTFVPIQFLRFFQVYMPTSFDKSFSKHEVNKHDVHFSFWDTSGTFCIFTAHLNDSEYTTLASGFYWGHQCLWPSPQPTPCSGLYHKPSSIIKLHYMQFSGRILLVRTTLEFNFVILLIALIRSTYEANIF